MKYRKKSVVIDAWPCRQVLQMMSLRSPLAKPAAASIPDECTSLYNEIVKPNGAFVVRGDDPEKGGGFVIIKTLEGNMTAWEDDMVIMGIKGEFYPCKKDIFEATYDQEAS